MTNRWPYRLTALLVLLAALPLAAAQDKPAEKPKQVPVDTHAGEYEIRYLDLHSAEKLAWDACTFRDSCSVVAQTTQGKSGGVLSVEADAATHEKIARELARVDVAPKTQSFHLLLLAGSTGAGSIPKDLSAGAQKALGDLKGFLPYKSYQLLDAALLPATRASTANARLVGRAGAAYLLRLDFDSGGTGADEQLFVSRFNLREDPETTPPPADAVMVGRGHRTARELVNTTFSLKPGETIVVGTSRLDGSDDALVVLLTALK